MIRLLLILIIFVAGYGSLFYFFNNAGNLSLVLGIWQLSIHIVQFLFVLFTSKPNSSISSFNDNIIEFFNDSLGFLLFNTEQKPFPFKSSSDEETIIDVDEIEEASSENEDATSEQKEN